MKIVFQYANPLPVTGYGGTERILFWHMVELARLGHKVVLLGHPDSDVKKYGIELIVCRENVPSSWEKLVPGDADIIHLSYNYKANIDVPTIATVHGNGQPGEVLIKNSVFVSKKHAEIHGADQFVYNAIDFAEYPFRPRSDFGWEKFLFLAKASWRVKNLAHTVAACRENKKHLHVAGGRWWGLSRYIHNHGIVGGEEKMKIIRECDALIFPVRWHEPFGIAVIEAMSQGLPVIGSHYGSLPELIVPEAGLIVENARALSDVVREPPRTFDPLVIRKYVEENFGIQKYSQSYLGLYQKVIAGNDLNNDCPTLRLKQRAEELLPF